MTLPTTTTTASSSTEPTSASHRAADPTAPVLVAVFGTGTLGSAVLQMVTSEAELRSARVVIVNATRGEAAVEPQFGTDEQVDAWVEHLEAHHVPVETHSGLTDGTVAEAIVETAEETGAAFLVIGVPHRSAVGKLLLGSTTQRVLLDARCPVIAVKA